MFRFASPEWLTALLVVPLMAGAFWYAARSRRLALERGRRGLERPPEMLGLER